MRRPIGRSVAELPSGLRQEIVQLLGTQFFVSIQKKDEVRRRVAKNRSRMVKDRHSTDSTEVRRPGRGAHSLWTEGTLQGSCVKKIDNPQMRSLVGPRHDQEEVQGPKTQARG